MATVVSQDVEVDAYKSCRDASCSGYIQRPIKGLKTTTSTSFLDLGGDLGPHEERSHEYLSFKDESEGNCEFCGQAAIISEQERPEYPRSSSDVSPQVPQVDPKMAVLVAEQAAAIARLEARLNDSAEQGSGRRFGGKD